MDHLHAQRNPIYLFLGCTGLFVLAAYVNIFPPEQIIYVLTFFILLFATLTILGLYGLRNLRRSAVLAGGLVLYLLLRFAGLRHPLYAILLIASVIAIEYLWKDRP